ncbi:biofilm PGA synthesis protein PgaB [Marinilabiliaceae bacterium JC040]|nr:biofilm PGA synthesis protein PgaB [Marinilabiliaceae bacterium JC040]
MKLKVFCYLAFIMLLFSCKSKEEIKVGVFNRNGDSPWCIEDAVEACKIDPAIKVKVISAAEIMNGSLDDYDVILFPGGGGTSETNSLGNKGMEKVKKMVVEKGKGVVGICAGSYILSNTPNYASFNLSGGEAIDIEHDHRGNGLAKFVLTEAGKKIFPELAKRDTLYCQYYEGPVLIPATGSKYKYTSLATMMSDVHIVEGTPANMTNNRPFVTMTECGKGRVATFVGHPECTAGMRFMVPRMIRWTLKKKLISYNAKVVRPWIYEKEILYTKEQKALMYKYYNQLRGDKSAVIEGIDKLVKMSPWSLKKWLPGLLRHNDGDVRIKAGKALVEIERTDAIPDFEAAIKIETNDSVKKSLEANLAELKEMANIK